MSSIMNKKKIVLERGGGVNVSMTEMCLRKRVRFRVPPVLYILYTLYMIICPVLYILYTLYMITIIMCNV